MKGILVLTLLVCLLPACTSRQRQVPPSTSLGRYNFSYSIENQAAPGLIQVFDDRKRTYLKFLPTTDQKSLEIRAKDNGSLRTKAEGGFLVVEGLHESLSVKSKEGEATIKKYHESTPKPRYAPLKEKTL